MERSFSTQKTTFLGGGLFFVCLLLYWPSFSNDYIWHDDNLYIIENPAVSDGLSFKGMVWAATTRYQNNWMPLTWLSYQVEGEFFGNGARPKLVVNFIVHLVNGALLILLLRSLGIRLSMAIFGGAFFLLHPACIETVAWAASRKGVLAGAFGLSACLLWIRGFRWIALLCFAASLMCKQSWVFLPVLFLLLDWRDGGKKKAVDRGQLGSAFLLAVAGGVMAVWANSLVPADERVTNLQSTGTRAIWAILAIVDHLRFAIFPLKPGISHVSPHGVVAFWSLGIAMVLIAAAWVAKGLKTWRKGLMVGLPLFGALWFLAALFPTSGIVPIGDVWRAERFLYPALPGMALTLVCLVQRIPSRFAISLMALLLVGHTVQSWTYLEKWSSPEALFLQSFQDEPEVNHVAAAKLGFFASRSGDDKEAREWFATVLKIEPRNVDALEGLAVMLAKSGNIREARAMINTAISLRPKRASLFYNLALCNLSENREREARINLDSALERDATFLPAIRLQKELDKSSP